MARGHLSTRGQQCKQIHPVFLLLLYIYFFCMYVFSLGGSFIKLFFILIEIFHMNVLIIYFQRCILLWDGEMDPHTSSQVNWSITASCCHDNISLSVSLYFFLKRAALVVDDDVITFIILLSTLTFRYMWITDVVTVSVSLSTSLMLNTPRGSGGSLYTSNHGKLNWWVLTSLFTVMSVAVV